MALYLICPSCDDLSPGLHPGEWRFCRRCGVYQERHGEVLLGPAVSLGLWRSLKRKLRGVLQW